MGKESYGQDLLIFSVENSWFPATSSDFIRLIAKLDARLRAERKHLGNT